MNQIKQEQSEKVASGLMKLLAIIGLIAVLALAAWGSVHVIRFVPNVISQMTSGTNGAAVTLSSLFSRGNNETLSLGLDKTVVNSGELFAMTINHTGGTANTAYTFTYECAGDTVLTLQNVTTAATSTACNTPITFTSTSSTLTVLPVSTKSRYSDVRMTITASPTQTGKEAPQDTALITVVNEHVASTSVTSVKTGTKTTSETASTVTVVRPIVRTGPADLAVSVDATGILVGDTFYKASNLPKTARGAVQFSVENKGGTASGTWTFTAELPTKGSTPFLFTSPTEPSLNAGDKITFTLGFDQLDKNGFVKVTLVPTMQDGNTLNNVAVATITVE